MRFKNAVLILSVIFITGGCSVKIDNTNRDRAQKVDDFIERQTASNKTPGLQYIIVSGDAVIYEKCAGFADIKAESKINIDTTMMIYSMTKTFTAAAVLQLADRKKLSLDDPAVKYIDYIPYGKSMTLRQLLAQTSGVPDPVPLKWVHLKEEDKTFNEDSYLKMLLSKYPNTSFDPGKKYKYSNISYWLLGKIIEKASGMSYKEYMRKNIFQALELSAGEIDFVIHSPEKHSKGYLKKLSFLDLIKSFVIEKKYTGEYEEKWLKINDHYLNGPSFGGITATAKAVSIFLQDQLRGESVLFSKGTKSLFFEQQSNNKGNPVAMTPGWHIGEINNELFYYKEGGGAGFHSEMRIYPSRDRASVVMANNTSFDVKGFLNAADKEF